MDLYPDSRARFTIGHAQTQYQGMNQANEASAKKLQARARAVLKQEILNLLDVGFINPSTI